MTLRAVRSLITLLLAVIIGGREMDAQSATGPVSINALLEAQMTGQGVRDLDFGRMIPGVTQSITPDNVASCAGCVSGQFSFLNLLAGGQAARRWARLQFTLPAQLTSPSGATLTPTWGNAARACLQKAGAEYFCYPIWTPVSGVFQSVQINGPGSPGTPGGPGQRDMNVYLGGTIAVPAAQAAGVYIGTVTLTFTYAAS